MTLLSANQIAYIFRANDNIYYSENLLFALSPEFLFTFDWFISFSGHVLVLFLTFSGLISPYFGWKMKMSAL